MRTALVELEQFLDHLARHARPGDRLPTIRDLMHRFGASQVVVQRAFRNLKAKGLIASHVGRGTYFCVDGDAATATMDAAQAPEVKHAAVRSVLLLRRSISLSRGRVLLEGLQSRFAADGHRVLEVSYTDPDHARTVLKGLPRFDACVVQSTFKPLTIDLLAALKDCSSVLAVDGAALVGADVEAVGMEWGVPLTEAVSMLQRQGHRRIGVASTSQPFLAIQMGRRQLEYLQNTLPDVELKAITISCLPDENYAQSLLDMVKASMDANGNLPYTALIVWGIEDGEKFRTQLLQLGLAVPSKLSVVLLGRTDLENEHANFFTTVGYSVADQVECLYQAIQTRWTSPAAPYGLKLLPLATRMGASTASPSLAASTSDQEFPPFGQPVVASH